MTTGPTETVAVVQPAWSWNTFWWGVAGGLVASLVIDSVFGSRGGDGYDEDYDEDEDDEEFGGGESEQDEHAEQSSE